MQNDLIERQVDAALAAAIPGGSKAEDWFLPHDDVRGNENVREVVRRMLVAAMQAGAKPVFWYRPRSDNGYEGPIHDAAMEDVRKLSGAWVPLFAWPSRPPVTFGARPGQEWKCGSEFLPYHPDASHVSPDYRDGWNAAYKVAQEASSCGG